jgi:hypothetical protein
MLAPEFAKLAELAFVKARPATKQYFDPLFAGGLSPIRRTTRRGIIVANRLDHGCKVPGDAKCKRAERRVHAQLLEEAAPVLCRVGTATREGDRDEGQTSDVVGRSHGVRARARQRGLQYEPLDDRARAWSAGAGVQRTELPLPALPAEDVEFANTVRARPPLVGVLVLARFARALNAPQLATHGSQDRASRARCLDAHSGVSLANVAVTQYRSWRSTTRWTRLTTCSLHGATR